MISIGIDVGSVAAKAVAYDGEKIIAKSITPTGWSPKEAGDFLMKDLMDKTNVKREDIINIVGTGYGRVSLPFIDKKITEITCHGKGAHFIDSDIRTVVDIGGQDSKVIKINSEGQVVDFLMNDKCAAGTGRFLQVMANALEVEVGDLSVLGRDQEPANISSMCTVFAESEVVSLVAEGKSKETIAAGLLQSVCNKTYALIGRVGVENKVFFSGGVSKNTLLVEMLEDKLGQPVAYSDDSQFLGAIGAAILGYKK